MNPMSLYLNLALLRTGRGLVIRLKGSYSDPKLSSFRTSVGNRMIRPSAQGRNREENREKTAHPGRANKCTEVLNVVGSNGEGQNKLGMQSLGNIELRT